MATRRNFLEKSGQLAAGVLAAGAVTASTSGAQTQQAQAPKKKLHILMRSSWGTDEPTRASFVFEHGLALAEAGHEVQMRNGARLRSTVSLVFHWWNGPTTSLVNEAADAVASRLISRLFLFLPFPLMERA
jgi:hypothetical protein